MIAFSPGCVRILISSWILSVTINFALHDCARLASAWNSSRSFRSTSLWVPQWRSLSLPASLLSSYIYDRNAMPARSQQKSSLSEKVASGTNASRRQMWYRHQHGRFVHVVAWLGHRVAWIPAAGSPGRCEDCLSGQVEGTNSDGSGLGLLIGRPPNCCKGSCRLAS